MKYAERRHHITRMVTVMEEVIRGKEMSSGIPKDCSEDIRLGHTSANSACAIIKRRDSIRRPMAWPGFAHSFRINTAKMSRSRWGIQKKNSSQNWCSHIGLPARVCLTKHKCVDSNEHETCWSNLQCLFALFKEYRKAIRGKCHVCLAWTVLGAKWQMQRKAGFTKSPPVQSCQGWNS